MFLKRAELRMDSRDSILTGFWKGKLLVPFALLNTVGCALFKVFR